jgi:hypothetical protein
MDDKNPFSVLHTMDDDASSVARGTFDDDDKKFTLVTKIDWDLLEI